MAGYRDLYKNAQAEGRTQNLKPELRRFENIGDEYIGKLLATDEVQSRQFESSYTMLTLDTDEGVIKLPLPRATASSVAPMLEIGHIYRLAYSDDQDTGRGNPMKVIDVEEIPVGYGDEDSLPF